MKAGEIKRCLGDTLEIESMRDATDKESYTPQYMRASEAAAAAAPGLLNFAKKIQITYTYIYKVGSRNI